MMDAQSLRSKIKSARDLMRKDAGLNTDVDRIPQLSWILFLKCFDDFEQKRKALDKNYTESIPRPYRWQDWARDEVKGLTGPDLIKFVNDKLFPELAGLVGGRGIRQRDVISSIFRELNNRILSGYVLRQVINLVNKINFISSDDIHTMAKLYEDMLIEMRDAAGSNGEFYTPRPLIRFIVKQIRPNLDKGEKILDPACGTGGFLVESLEVMKEMEKTKTDYKKLRTLTLFGIEKKPMPYLLAMMNMLLHEIDDPNIVRTNTLSKPLREITEEHQYDIIMTNPPFGGEEEAEIPSNLPVGMQTSDTALAFLLYILYSLKVNGRCAIILPNGPLFNTSAIAFKIKAKLLSECNLHTIVRLPESVFSPYTTIQTNILFFDKTGPTNEIWYYQMKIRDGLKFYNKTNPMSYEDFSAVISWWNNRTENENAWKVKTDEIENYNLDQKNTKQIKEGLKLSPQEIVQKLINDEEKIIRLLNEIKDLAY